MNFQRIECFLMVAYHKNFSRAANDLFLAQSSVTGQIKKLEEEVGFQVLERGRDGVRLTPAGECLYEEMKHIMGSYTNAVDRCRQIARQENSLLTIGYPNPPEWGNMPELIRSFQRQNPQAKVQLKLNKGRQLMELFQTGSMDILFGDMGYLEQLNGVRSFPLFKAPFFVLIPSGHELDGRDRVTVDELNHYGAFCLSPEIQDATIGTLSNRMRQAGIKMENLYPVSHREDVVASVYAGMGLGVVPGTLKREYYQTHVALLDAPEAYLSQGCVCRSMTKNSLRDKFVRLAQAYSWLE